VVKLADRLLIIVSAIALCGIARAESSGTGPKFEVSLPSSSGHQPAVTGRLFVLIGRNNDPELRLRDYWFDCPEFLGVDVAQLKPGAVTVVDSRTLGYPFRSLKDIPAGDYYVQAALTNYVEYRRADGHVVWALDQWDGHVFNASPGNLYSAVQKIHLDASKNYKVRLSLTNVVPPALAPPDTEWVKRVKIQSTLLTRFWGRPIYIGAVVLLPRDYAAHPDLRYPVIYQQQAHFNHLAPFEFSTVNLPEKEDDRIERENDGYESGYEFYQSWRSEHFPRVVAVALQHPTPYSDMSATINSANNGPYGDAIVTELIPYLEEHFRISREPGARMLIGKSAGGRDALAQQLHYPQLFGGAWIFHPWAFSYQDYFDLNIYKNDNAFQISSAESPLWAGWWTAPEWAPLERPWVRTLDGQPLGSMRQLSHHDAVMAGSGPGGEFGTDDSILGPVREDGYPKPLWDRMTGKIDRDVAEYWREHGDLAHYAEANWSKIGPHLVGKLHFYVGDMDEFYRNHGVHHFEDVMRSTKDPYFGGSFEYAPLKAHGWQPMTNAELVRMIADQVARNAAPGTSLAWRND
jgi:predicted alpha/beta superfamily hydrolase